jgi:hypothetical protein
MMPLASSIPASAAEEREIVLMRFPLLYAAACLALNPGLSLAQQQQQPAPQPDAAPAETAAPQPETGRISLELNKLTAAGNACQAFFIVDNQTPEALGELTVDIYLFDAEGVILRGLALQFADLRSGRATVVPFELPDLPCGNVSRVLLNNVLTCTDAQGAAVPGCAERIGVSTRTAPFEY